jgi:hypothetical protein
MKFDTIYSLGSRCQNSEILKKYNYREFSGFFDFMNTHTVDNIIHILDDNFQELLNPANNVILTCNVLTIEPETGIPLATSKRTSNRKYNKDTSDVHSCIFPHHDLSSVKDYDHFVKCKKRFKTLNSFNVLFNYTFNMWENNISKDQAEKISEIINKTHGFSNFKICFIGLNICGTKEYKKVESHELWDMWHLCISPYSFTGGLFSDCESNENYINIIRSYDISENRITKEQIDNLI